MKIRIKGNSVRYRLSKTDLKNLELNQTIEERTNFGEATLTYQLVPSAAHQELDAALNDNCIKVFIPEHFLKVWNSNELVSLTAVKELADGNQLQLLVEKDFQCLDKTSEDQSDFLST